MFPLRNCLQTLPLNLSISCPAVRGKETTRLILPLLQAPLSFRGKYSKRIILIFQAKYPWTYSSMFDPTPPPKILSFLGGSYAHHCTTNTSFFGCLKMLKPPYCYEGSWPRTIPKMAQQRDERILMVPWATGVTNSGNNQPQDFLLSGIRNLPVIKERKKVLPQQRPLLS